VWHSFVLHLFFLVYLFSIHILMNLWRRGSVVLGLDPFHERRHYHHLALPCKTLQMRCIGLTFHNTTSRTCRACWRVWWTFIKVSKSLLLWGDYARKHYSFLHIAIHCYKRKLSCLCKFEICKKWSWSYFHVLFDKETKATRSKDAPPPTPHW